MIFLGGGGVIFYPFSVGWMNGDEWIDKDMDRLRILFVPIHPTMDE